MRSVPRVRDALTGTLVVGVVLMREVAPFARRIPAVAALANVVAVAVALASVAAFAFADATAAAAGMLRWTDL